MISKVPLGRKWDDPFLVRLYNQEFAKTPMSKERQPDTLKRLLGPLARRAEADIARLLVEPGCPAELAEAMRYSVLGGGKRLRPALVHLSARAAGGDADGLTARAAVAVELVHCYSLVHDDLPAMDDDVLRRGRPTVHVKFGQAMAILAGDALLTRAFAVLADGRDERAGRLTAALSEAAGQAGMIGGQVADMGLTRVRPGLDALRSIHLRKTAAIIRACGRMGAICARAGKRVEDALACYAELLGLAFQVTDDVLDVTGRADRIGKTPGKDAAAGKRTYVSELGLERARALAIDLTAQAIAAVAPLGRRAAKLVRLANALADRSH